MDAAMFRPSLAEQKWTQDPVVAQREDHDSEHGHIQAAQDPLPVLQQSSRSGKRNKPTLSCLVCVERKSKCDRGRPACLSCVRRQCPCQYSARADSITVHGNARSRKQASVAKVERQPEILSYPSLQMATTMSSPPVTSPSGVSDTLSHRPTSPALTPASTFLSATILRPLQAEAPSKDRPALFNLFGMSARHPFQNYWTATGGLAEVISVVPSQNEADVLVQCYFEVIDPLYPVVHRETFLAEYRRFWRTPDEEKHLCDPAHLALQFAMYAIGMQHNDAPSTDARETTSDFYLSCCHQSLCISSYLNQCTLATVQSMILICNYLLGSHRVSDAWTFSGITQRQAYGLGLNRNPHVLHPTAPYWENQIRCRLWQAIMFQDTSLSLWLELPPATIYYEIDPSCLRLPEEHLDADLSQQIWNETPAYTMTDISYLRSTWRYAQFVQHNMCISKSLRRPIATNAAHKADLISRFCQLYLDFDPPFNSYMSSRYEEQSPRLTRQIISLCSNFFYAMSVLYMEEDEVTGVACDVYGALDAAHEGLSAFFALARLSPGQMNTWGVAQTRAYTQATMLGTVLVAHTAQADQGLNFRDPRLMLAKSNLDRYLDILVRAQGNSDFDALRVDRVAELTTLRSRIRVI